MLALVFVTVLHTVSAGFEYDTHSDDGPPLWSKLYPKCGGDHQSPIDIHTNIVRYGHSYNIAYKKASYLNGIFFNNGHAPTFKVDQEDRLHELGLTGVPGSEKDSFLLANFHFHFGPDDDHGSEHKVNSRSFAGEIHFVHFNSKYGSVSDAFPYPDGLTVLAMFMVVDTKSYNPTLNDFFYKYLGQIKDLRSSVNATCDVMSLLPHNFEFYTYQGSLTTPRCFESVRWVVLRHPIRVQHSVFEALRRLESDDHNHNPMGVCGNFRPVQPLNDRIVEANFHPDKSFTDKDSDSDSSSSSDSSSDSSSESSSGSHSGSRSGSNSGSSEGSHSGSSESSHSESSKGSHSGSNEGSHPGSSEDSESGGRSKRSFVGSWLLRGLTERDKENDDSSSSDSNERHQRWYSNRRW